MPTRNIELTKGWMLIASGPVPFISFEPSRKAKYSSICQIAIATALPAPDFEGHPVSDLTSAQLDAGDNLYARAGGDRGLMIVTDTPAVAAQSSSKTIEREVLPIKQKLNFDSQKNNNRKNSREGDQDE